MKPVAFIWLLVLCVSGCGRSGETHWRDGSFKVYALDLDFNATCLGYDNHPGILGLVEAEVVAAGSDEKCVVVEQLDPVTEKSHFFIVPKEKGEFHSGSVEGPFTREEFTRAGLARKLPAFSWRTEK